MQRADIALISAGLALSRSKAQALIKAGCVFYGEAAVAKPSDMIEDASQLRLEGLDHPWVSRGGMKLAEALKVFEISPAGLVCLDIGASTGGFTDVLLHHGAAKVYAVDVGHDQLVAKLKDDPRVILREGTNARTLSHEDIPEPVDLVVCDASFISLSLVLPAALALAKPGARLIALIKPQFEVGKERLGKGGVVKDPALHEEVCQTVRRWLENFMDWKVLGLADSPITGPAGNQEFLIAAQKG